jgi:hypothetical protein
MRYGILVVLIAILMTGCSQQITLRPDGAAKNQTVSVKLRSGASVTGEVESRDAESLVIKDRAGQTWRAQMTAITKITGPKPVFDGAGNIISEKEIRDHKYTKNALLFSLSGGVLSLGTSFFLSSMLSRASADHNRDTILYSGSAGGTIAGVFLFSHMGAKKDRQQAIQKVRQERSLEKGETNLNDIVSKKAQVQSEMETLRKERAAQDEEIKKLEKKIQEKQNK